MAKEDKWNKTPKVKQRILFKYLKFMLRIRRITTGSIYIKGYTVHTDQYYTLIIANVFFGEEFSSLSTISWKAAL